MQSDKNQNAKLEILNNGKPIATKSVSLFKGANKVDIPFEIPNPKRWWSNGLGEAYLYKITASVNVNESTDN